MVDGEKEAANTQLAPQSGIFSMEAKSPGQDGCRFGIETDSTDYRDPWFVTLGLVDQATYTTLSMDPHHLKRREIDFLHIGYILADLGEKFPIEAISLRGRIPLMFAMINGISGISPESYARVMGNIEYRNNGLRIHPFFKFISDGDMGMAASFSRVDCTVRRLFYPGALDIDGIVDGDSNEIIDLLREGSNWERNQRMIVRGAGNGKTILFLGRGLSDNGEGTMSSHAYLELLFREQNPLSHKSNLEKCELSMSSHQNYPNNGFWRSKAEFIMRNIPRVTESGRFEGVLPQYPEDINPIYKFWSIAKSLGYFSLYDAEMKSSEYTDIPLSHHFMLFEDTLPGRNGSEVPTVSSINDIERFERGLIELFWAYNMNREQFLSNINLLGWISDSEHEKIGALESMEFVDFINYITDGQAYRTLKRMANILDSSVKSGVSEFLIYLLDKPEDAVWYLYHSIDESMIRRVAHEYPRWNRRKRAFMRPIQNPNSHRDNLLYQERTRLPSTPVGRLTVHI